MIILGIETSTFAGSIALFKEGKILGEYTFNIGPMHNEKLIPSIKWLLEQTSLNKKDIDVISVSYGPGSFTSLRVGVSTAKTLSFSLGAKLVSVSSLEVLASNVTACDYEICPMINAKKNEVYYALFKNTGELERTADDSHARPEDLLDSLKGKTVFLGDGAVDYSTLIEKKLGKRAIFLPSHLNIARASGCIYRSMKKIEEGKFEDPEYMVPNYIRKSEAEIKRERETADK